jgi:acyl-CoA dehydrogenase family protein 9
VQDKLAWLVSQLFAVESMTYLTTGMVDRGGLDVSIETALCKVYSTDFLLGAANRALDLRGGLGYMRSEPYERILRDVRIFPIFEGANDVLRAWIGLKGFKAVVERLGGGEQRSAGAEPSLPGLELVRARAERLADRTEALLMNHGEAAAERQLDQHRIARAACEVYAQTAVAARMADEPAGAPSEPVARAFMEWSGARADEALDAIDTTDDAPTAELAALAYAGEAYQHPFRR